MSKVLEIVKKITGNYEITNETLLLDDGILDSLLVMELIDKLEKEFDIKIPPDEFSHYNFNQVTRIEELVDKLKG